MSEPTQISSTNVNTILQATSTSAPAAPTAVAAVVAAATAHVSLEPTVEEQNKYNEFRTKYRYELYALSSQDDEKGTAVIGVTFCNQRKTMHPYCAEVAVETTYKTAESCCLGQRHELIEQDASLKDVLMDHFVLFQSPCFKRGQIYQCMQTGCPYSAATPGGHDAKLFNFSSWQTHTRSKKHNNLRRSELEKLTDNETAKEALAELNRRMEVLVKRDASKTPKGKAAGDDADDGAAATPSTPATPASAASLQFQVPSFVTPSSIDNASSQEASHEQVGSKRAAADSASAGTEEGDMLEAKEEPAAKKRRLQAASLAIDAQSQLQPASIGPTQTILQQLQNAEPALLQQSAISEGLVQLQQLWNTHSKAKP